MAVSENDVIKALEEVKHPAIDLSLIKLGMLKNIKLEGNSVSADFCFPFPNIPIKEMLFSSIQTPLEGMGLTVTFTETIMNQDEVQQFLALETANWKN
ncbi:MAG: iron-sulfur cluster assembly protein [Spirochaetota bacterium]|nr:iron-sulfur cluster assembly protein [Spirochaetota bacterium]